MNIQARYLTAALFVCLVTTASRSAHGASYKDDPKLEPFALTREMIRELTQAETNAMGGTSFRLKGLTIKTGTQRTDSIALSVQVDPRLNLWRGRANDLASSQLGTMKLIVSSITDNSGANIHNKSLDRPWSSKITIYNRGDGIFSGGRSANFKAAKGATLKRISGTIELSLPVNLDKYVIRTDSPDSTTALLARPNITDVKLKDGIEISYAKGTPHLQMIVMAFNSDGERISITMNGTAGTLHYYRVQKDQPIAEIRIFIPKDIVQLEIPFSLDMKDQ